MKTYTSEELKNILELHQKWLQEETGGVRANLSGAYLTGANLTGANLSRANLYGANLSGANLSRANLSGAYLTGANLTGADLYGANLYGANLSEANLSEAKIDPQNLANLVVKRSIVPESGAFTAYKKVVGGTLLTLEIPSTAKRLGGLVGRKCRASEAKVVASNDDKIEWTSQHDPNFKYKIGETIKVDFCEDPMLECASGIHFFINKQEAVEY